MIEDRWPQPTIQALFAILIFLGSILSASKNFKYLIRFLENP